MISTLKKLDPTALAEIEDEMRLRQTREVFLLFSLGSQFDLLIKLALDRLGVYCLVGDPGSLSASEVYLLNPVGILLSGGPASIHVEAPPFDLGIFDLGIPVLGICLGFQLWAAYRGVIVSPANRPEYGTHPLQIHFASQLFDGIDSGTPVLQSHGDWVEPKVGLEVLAKTDHSPVAAARQGHLWGVQFHPEVTETVHGDRMLENFCFDICGAKDRFPAENQAAKKVQELKREIGRERVLLAISGGSDSATVAYLLREAVPGQIDAVYIKGVDRPDDWAYVERYFGHEYWLNLEIVDATDLFLGALAGQGSMPDKRKAMKGVYREVIERVVASCGAGYIAQGTLYTDITESGGGYDTAATKARIKEHHNIGLGFSRPELMPLDDCVKDTARQIGRAVGTPEELLIRHPFPGPGLVVRILGEVTAENLAIARAADGIYIEELRHAGLYNTVWQAGAVVTQSVTTCTKGDGDATGLELSLWAVWSVNGMTAEAAELPFDFLRKVSKRITDEIAAVGVVTYRTSDKPPATIEWG